MLLKSGQAWWTEESSKRRAGYSWLAQCGVGEKEF